MNWIPVMVFAVCYALFVALPKLRPLTACGGAAALILTGALTWRQALLEMVNWNVIGLFVGTLVLAELFMQSRMPAVLAEWLVDRSRTALGAMLAICVLSSVLSMFLENVAVVLLVAPVAFSLCEKLKTSPVKLIVAIAICSNLQGTATLIGDPPSMIMAGYMKLSFNDFFFYHGRPSIFFAVQCGAVASLLILAVLLRRHREPVQIIPVERVRSGVPSVLLLALVLGLATSTVWDPDFRWFAGAYTLLLALAGLVWYRTVPHWGSIPQLLRTLDYATTFFLIGVFIVVGGLSESGWLDRLAEALTRATGGSLPRAFVLITAVAVIVSGFVDNVPFLLAMIPVAQKVVDDLGVREPAVLQFALLIGACLGGNITPIGASANVVAIGMLKQKGHVVTFRQFMALGVPFTLAAVLAACVFVWLIWA